MSPAVQLCKTCAVEYPRTGEFFHRRKDGRYGLDSQCKACNRSKVAAYRLRPEAKRIARNTRFVAEYGITLDEYERMHSVQRGLCAICQKAESRVHNKSRSVQRLCVDHDSSSGAVRRLLCHACNAGLGYFKHDPMILAAAAKYLSDHASDSRCTATEPPATPSVAAVSNVLVGVAPPSRRRTNSSRSLT